MLAGALLFLSVSSFLIPVVNNLVFVSPEEKLSACCCVMKNNIKGIIIKQYAMRYLPKCVVKFEILKQKERIQI